MNRMKLLTIICSGVFLGACSNMNNQDVGVIAGGVVGGVLGNQIGGGTGRILATVGGAALGAYLGGRIGKYMDKTDQLEMNRALEKTPTHKNYSWRNPDTKIRYDVQPTRTYVEKGQGGQSQPCREYTTTALIDGKAEKVVGRACRGEDGSWKVVNG